ncbi:hypothetical protein Riv7116_0963 [Rivularia sp. PCC 7116]|uniref:hypothetical protein n=1 Tax=Rivularia sp. PCC 7116 TaxID=373994 RepID=UPI00029F32C1|nr:hypothetical protein [Rivularia sp. PCC 7116]AFY53538.1 hypothetical protein Riv7116_0963 [Rivularia sp. PCC 7116]
MSNGKSPDSDKLSYKLQEITDAIHEYSVLSQGDILEILALLRQLEKLHRQVRDGIFQENLPSNRQALYSLLKDIEAEGGWPYIERMRIQNLMVNLETIAEEES